jgi:hypothetical protein
VARQLDSDDVLLAYLRNLSLPDAEATMSRFSNLLIVIPILSLSGCAEDRPETLGPAATLEPTAARPAAALASNTWVRFADLPTLRFSATMAAVPKADGTSRLFAIAGKLRKTRTSGSGQIIVYTVPVGTVTEYLPATNRWVRRADAPYVWQWAPQAGVLGGKIYLPGGLTGHGPVRLATRTMAVYDVATNTWTSPSMPQYMTSQTVWTAGGALYVFGQCDDAATWNFGPGTDCQRTGAAPKFLLRYSPATNNWTYLPTPPVEARVNPVSGMIGGRAYVTAGGLAALDSYDPSTGIWRGWQPLARARDGAAGAAVKGKLYVAGGFMAKPDGSWGQSRALSEYNPAANSWLNRAQLPELFEPNVIRAARVMIGGQARLAILGGFGKHYQWAP